MRGAESDRQPGQARQRRAIACRARRWIVGMRFDTSHCPLYNRPVIADEARKPIQGHCAILMA